MKSVMLFVTACLAIAGTIAQAGTCQVDRRTGKTTCPAQPARRVNQPAAKPVRTVPVVSKKPAAQPVAKSAEPMHFDLEKEWENMSAQIRKIDPNIPEDVLTNMKTDFQSQVQSEMNKQGSK
ncbi:hypothetical protein Noda2021_09460 [Candidatus Dependentiae bacterium Noda2021]|nr:hypothetical protein Noda2021_09460 [Candidatus Dependentiae bacterium Noda2021]